MAAGAGEVVRAQVVELHPVTQDVPNGDQQVVGDGRLREYRRFGSDYGKGRGRRGLPEETVELVLRLARDNPRWATCGSSGKPKIGVAVSGTSVQTILRRHALGPAPERFRKGRTCGPTGDRVGGAGHAPRGREHVAGAQQRLDRDAAPAGALATDELALDDRIARAIAMGDEAGRLFSAMHAPGGAVTPVLWPEHFDIGIALDDVNYGVSAGDDSIPEPYAYVGPHEARRGPFWDQPFGATRLIQDLAGVPDLLAFFEQGRAHAAQDPTI